jgi:hypothetical protein
MNTPDCTLHRNDIAAFLDGELRGAGVRRVLQHLEQCEVCANEVAELRALGESIRISAPEVAPPELDGLASTVVSRARAEDAESWSSVFRRAREDWHWAIVGTGAVAATFVSTLLLSAILAFGPKPDRNDSLSAFYTNFRTSAGQLFLVATPVGQDDQEPLLLEVNENGASRTAAVYATWYAEQRTEAAVVDALQEAVTAGGQTLGLNEMSPQRREYTESLLEEISRFRTAAPLPYGVALAVHEVRLFASASVTAKGL